MDKLTSYWANGLFNVANVSGPATIIAKRQRDGKAFARKISVDKKYKHISNSDDHSDIDSSGSAEMNKENTHLYNRGSNTDNAQNKDI